MNAKLIASLTILAAGLAVASADVQANWDKHCAKCHGPDGKGETKLGKKAEVKDMTDPAYQASLKDDKAFTSVKQGIKDGDRIRMKAAEGLTDDEIKALIAHVRAFKK